MALIVPKDGREVAQRAAVHVFADPIPHAAVKCRQLPAVLLVPATRGRVGPRRSGRGRAVGLLGCPVVVSGRSRGFDRSRAVES